MVSFSLLSKFKWEYFTGLKSFFFKYGSILHVKIMGQSNLEENNFDRLNI